MFYLKDRTRPAKHLHQVLALLARHGQRSKMGAIADFLFPGLREYGSSQQNTTLEQSRTVPGRQHTLVTQSVVLFRGLLTFLPLTNSIQMFVV